MLRRRKPYGAVLNGRIQDVVPPYALLRPAYLKSSLLAVLKGYEASSRAYEKPCVDSSRARAGRPDLETTWAQAGPLRRSFARLSLLVVIRSLESCWCQALDLDCTMGGLLRWPTRACAEADEDPT